MRKLGAALAFVLVVAGGYGAYHWWTATPTESTAPYTLPALTKEYANVQYGFALKMPEDFEATESQDPESGVTFIVLQNSRSEGVQIMVSPFDEDAEGSYILTKERILQDIPDIKLSDVQTVEVGPNYTGLAFKSDNEAFGGASRAVWFVYQGNLYQINTYERLDNLLKAMFGTWNFQ